MISIYTAKEALREGVYHEIGHIIAMKLFSPNEEKISFLQMYQKPNSSYGLRVVKKDSTKLSFKDPDFKNQLKAFTIENLAGGVFQQMKTAQRVHRAGYFNLMSKNISLLDFYQQVVSPVIPGMEEDLGEVLAVYQGLLENKVIDSNIDLEKEKNDCVSLLLPFVDSPEIDTFCDECVNVFLDKGMDNVPSVEIPIDDIMNRIGKLF